jgi:hypothetical protein
MRFTCAMYALSLSMENAGSSSTASAGAASRAFFTTAGSAREARMNSDTVLSHARSGWSVSTKIRSKRESRGAAMPVFVDKPASGS